MDGSSQQVSENVGADMSASSVKGGGNVIPAYSLPTSGESSQQMTRAELVEAAADGSVCGGIRFVSSRWRRGPYR